MRNARSLTTVLLVPFLLECHDQTITAPGVPESARAIAIRLHVDVAAGTVQTISDAAAQKPSLNLMTSGGVPAPSFSLLGSDGIAVQSSNVQQSPLGANKTLVRFDLALTNSLQKVTLIKPTVPTPPAGVTGIVLFPFQAKAAGGSSGNVTTSADWDGAPFSFFNDTHCTGAPSTDCFRWEEYPSLASGATSAARTVGFEVDKGVQAFDVVMLLAADLQNVPDAPAAIGLSDATAQIETATGSAPVSILVANAGGGTLSDLSANVTYAAGQPAGWLSATLSSTTAPALLKLTAYQGPFGDGTYTATVAIASPGVSNSPQTVSVTFVVTNSNLPSSDAIYVSQSDAAAIDDASCGLGPTGSGSFAHPCLSITQGLSRASATGRSEVRVADGHYTEAITLVNGKSLLGGYQPDTWLRHVSSTNTIIDGVSSSAGHNRTVIAANVTNPTLFEGFVVRGSANNTIGGNSYAIYVSSSSQNLAIRHNVIYAGSGGPGIPGVAGSPGIRFADGTGRTESNPSIYDAFVTPGTSPCSPTNNRSYTNGAVSVGADNISGGNGGGNLCPPSANLVQMSAQNGLPGQSGAGTGGGIAGAGGVGGLDFRLESNGTLCVVATLGTQTGANGGAGGNGQAGAAVMGAAAAIGSVVAGGHWAGSSGANGVAGFNGGGGGGGGAGGGASWQSTTSGHDQLGGAGGGGGAGGTGGGGGGAGTAGGGAFGIFIVGGAAPTISDNAIVRGIGGNGGAGGAGGAGAAGSEGGAGGQSIFCAGAGGHGGKGGSGGAGSGGGGGAGGASFGIFTSGVGIPSYCTTGNNTVSGGAAGLGGTGGFSPVNSGGAGTGGALMACSFN